MTESLVYYTVKAFAVFIRLLPIRLALWIGRIVGLVAYYFDVKHKSFVFANLKVAFACTKTPREIKEISKQLFKNYGQNLIELLRLPLLNPGNFHELIEIEGKQHVDEALKKGKGVILLAMHSGSWELANLACAMMDHPYKVIVKPQKRFSRLDELLNSYRECGGSVVIERGMGIREFIKSLRNNEIVGMVLDQGGKSGVLVPFFNKQASMSVGAIRVGLKFDVPICFAVIIRKKGGRHKLVLHKAFDLDKSDNIENDISVNLSKITHVMERHIIERPAEYMWFYKIWKYSKESTIVILNDGRTGHLRQSQAVAKMVEKALSVRDISTTTKTIEVFFKNCFAASLLSVLSVFANDYIYQGRLSFMKWFLRKESFDELMSVKADFIISCGSSRAAVNYLLASDQQAKSIAVLKPGILPYGCFDLVVLPSHDKPSRPVADSHIVITKGAMNLVDNDYIDKNKDLFLRRFSHLKTGNKMTIGLLLGGDTKNFPMTERKIRVVINQIKEAAKDINADILVSTSRRTSLSVENLLQYELKRDPCCKLLILANRNNVPEAVGGILGLSDIIVVSGDSISMISEAASSGKKTLVFSTQSLSSASNLKNKHNRFINMLHQEGFIFSSDTNNIRQSINDLAKNKIQTRHLDDNEIILKAIKRII